MEELLRIEDLTVTYGSVSSKNKHTETGIRNINFSLKKGEVCGIIGESGGGKSTLLSAVMGLLHGKADIKGKIIFNGKEIQNAKKESDERNFIAKIIGTRGDMTEKEEQLKIEKKLKKEGYDAIIFDMTKISKDEAFNFLERA